jgi:peptidoglycan/LPS O-acetylase OafA/YrhL
VLSGFVIHYNYGASIAAKGAPAIRSFLIARFARLYPLYILVLLITIALVPSIVRENAFPQWCWRYLTMTQDWTPTLIGDRLVATLYVGSAWSISAEVGLYIFYLVVAASLDGMRTVRTTLCAIAVLSIAGTIVAAGFMVCRAAAPGMVAFIFSSLPCARIFARRADRAALPHRPGSATRVMDRVRRSLLDRCLVCGLFFVSEFPSVLWLRSGRCCVDVLFYSLPQPRRFSDRDPDHAFAWRGELQHLHAARLRSVVRHETKSLFTGRFTHRNGVGLDLCGRGHRLSLV